MNKLNQNINKNNKQDNNSIVKKNIYLNPLRENYNSKRFFKLNQEYREKLWILSNSEILLLINVWIRNKTEDQYYMSNKELVTIKYDSFENSFYSHSSPKRMVDKLIDVDLISVSEDIYGKKYSCNYDDKKSKDIYIPLNNIVHYLDVFGRRGVNIYFYILYLFYNVENPMGKKYFKTRKRPILLKEIQKKLNYGIGTVSRTVKELDEKGFLNKTVRHGKANMYYLPNIARQ